MHRFFLIFALVPALSLGVLGCSSEEGASVANPVPDAAKTAHETSAPKGKLKSTDQKISTGASAVP